MYDNSPSQFLTILYPLIIGAVIVFAIWSNLRRRDRIEEILAQWERENRVTILQRAGIWFSIDPFAMFAGKTRSVYRITVQERSGSIREALIRVRTKDLFYQDSCEVKWLD